VPKGKGGERDEETLSEVRQLSCGFSHCCNNNECKFNMPLHYASGLIAGRS